MRKKKQVIDREIFVQAGKKGAKTLSERYSTEFFSKNGKRGAKVRWDKEKSVKK